jgi:hypothetical protein
MERVRYPARCSSRCALTTRKTDLAGIWRVM